MKRAGVLVGAIIVALLSVSLAAQVRAEVALRAAVEQETVKGDLKGAIEAYKKIVDGYRDNRPVRAQALLRMAECYQKLGDAQATEVYKRIVREFADQPQAAVAREKVAPATGSARGLAMRRVATGLDLWPDDVSPQGDRVAFTDWASGNIALRDVPGDRVVRVTSQPPLTAGAFAEFGMTPVFSPDGSQIAYTWCVVAGNACNTTVRVSRVAENEPQAGRVVYTAGLWIRVYDWSPDAKQLAAVNTGDGDIGEIVVIDVANGAVRKVRALERGDTPVRIAFSPDGRHLAFDAMVAARGADRGRREVFVRSVSGGAEHPVAVTNGYRALVGWSPDGDRLLFTTDNRGTVDMYSIPVAAGQPKGPAALIKSDLGNPAPLRVDRAGRLFYSIQTGGGTRIKHAGFDFSKGMIAEPPASVDDGAPGTNTGPQWSPDGRSLAYVHRRQTTPQSRSTVMVRENASGETRELLVDLIRLDQLRWGGDGRSLYALGADVRGAAVLYGIDVQTGGTSRLASGDALRHLRLNNAGTAASFLRSASGRHRFMELDLRSSAEREIFAFEAAGNPAGPQMSPDETKIYYRRTSAAAAGTPASDVLVERDLKSGAERELLRGRIPFMLLSPDGRHVAVRRPDPAGQWVAISIVPTAGEPVPREVMRVEQVVSAANVAAWSPDGRSLLINKLFDGPARSETWWVPIDGAAPRKLDQFMGNIHLHPDGRRVAFQVPNSEPALSDIWVMEEFLGRSGTPPVRRRR